MSSSSVPLLSLSPSLFNAIDRIKKDLEEVSFLFKWIKNLHDGSWRGIRVDITSQTATIHYFSTCLLENSVDATANTDPLRIFRISSSVITYDAKHRSRCALAIFLRTHLLDSPSLIQDHEVLRKYLLELIGNNNESSQAIKDDLKNLRKDTLQQMFERSGRLYDVFHQLLLHPTFEIELLGDILCQAVLLKIPIEEFLSDLPDTICSELISKVTCQGTTSNLFIFILEFLRKNYFGSNELPALLVKIMTPRQKLHILLLNNEMKKTDVTRRQFQEQKPEQIQVDLFYQAIVNYLPPLIPYSDLSENEVHDLLQIYSRDCLFSFFVQDDHFNLVAFYTQISLQRFPTQKAISSRILPYFSNELLSQLFDNAVSANDQEQTVFIFADVISTSRLNLIKTSNYSTQINLYKSLLIRILEHIHTHTPNQLRELYHFHKTYHSTLASPIHLATSFQDLEILQQMLLHLNEDDSAVLSNLFRATQLPTFYSGEFDYSIPLVNIFRSQSISNCIAFFNWLYINKPTFITLLCRCDVVGADKNESSSVASTNALCYLLPESQQLLSKDIFEKYIAIISWFQKHSPQCLLQRNGELTPIEQTLSHVKKLATLRKLLEWLKNEQPALLENLFSNEESCLFFLRKMAYVNPTHFYYFIKWCKNEVPQYFYKCIALRDQDRNTVLHYLAHKYNMTAEHYPTIRSIGKIFALLKEEPHLLTILSSPNNVNESCFNLIPKQEIIAEILSAELFDWLAKTSPETFQILFETDHIGRHFFHYIAQRHPSQCAQVVRWFKQHDPSKLEILCLPDSSGNTFFHIIPLESNSTFFNRIGRKDNVTYQILDNIILSLSSHFSLLGLLISPNKSGQTVFTRLPRYIPLQNVTCEERTQYLHEITHELKTWKNSIVETGIQLFRHPLADDFEEAVLDYQDNLNLRIKLLYKLKKLMRFDPETPLTDEFINSIIFFIGQIQNIILPTIMSK